MLVNSQQNLGHQLFSGSFGIPCSETIRLHLDLYERNQLRKWVESSLTFIKLGHGTQTYDGEALVGKLFCSFVNPRIPLYMYYDQCEQLWWKKQNVFFSAVRFMKMATILDFIALINVGLLLKPVVRVQLKVAHCTCVYYSCVLFYCYVFRSFVFLLDNEYFVVGPNHPSLPYQYAPFDANM